MHIRGGFPPAGLHDADRCGPQQLRLIVVDARSDRRAKVRAVSSRAVPLPHETRRARWSRVVEWNRSVIGPASIGKSRLAWEFTKYLDGIVGNVWWHDGRSPAYGEGRARRGPGTPARRGTVHRRPAGSPPASKARQAGRLGPAAGQPTRRPPDDCPLARTPGGPGRASAMPRIRRLRATSCLVT